MLRCAVRPLKRAVDFPVAFFLHQTLPEAMMQGLEAAGGCGVSTRPHSLWGSPPHMEPMCALLCS